MVFSSPISTAAGVSEASAILTRIRVCRGLVYKMEVDFPPGSQGLLHIQIYDGSYQVLPASPGKSLVGDNRLLSYDDLYLKQAAPYEFVVKTWNLDDTYQHSVQIRIAMALSEAFMSRYMPSIQWEKFASTLRRAQGEEKKERERLVSESIKKVGG